MILNVCRYGFPNSKYPKIALIASQKLQGQTAESLELNSSTSVRVKLVP